MLSLTLTGLSLPTLHLPLKGLSTTFGSAPASQKLFGLNSTNIGSVCAIRRNSARSLARS